MSKSVFEDRTERELILYRLELEEWIIAKCRIEEEINRVKVRIENHEKYLQRLRKKAGK